MKIIELGIVVDVNDPKGYERIRYMPYSDLIGPKERAFDYEPWGERDLFVARPFLPPSVNHLPEVGQSVKIICYESNKTTTNQEYVAGPFTTSHDFNSQTFSNQVQDTSYGAVAKQSKKIFSEDGKYVNPKSEGSLAKSKDHGLYGKYGSDLIFTESGLMLRGGKLLSKEDTNSNTRKTMISTPIMANKSAKLYLKKFSRKLSLKEKDTTEIITQSRNLSHIIEYDVDFVNTPNIVDIYVYKVPNNVYGEKYNTKYFTEHTELDLNLLTLLNLSGNTANIPTFSVTIGTGSTNPTKDAYLEIRNILHTIESDGLRGMKNENVKYAKFTDELLHPFYFRPSKKFKESFGSNSTKIEIINNVYLRNIEKYGLIWSKDEVSPPAKEKPKKEYITVKQTNSTEESFGSLVADKIYFLSTDTNEANETSVPFDQLDKYEYTQDDYVRKITPNTFSSVRGETLLELLYAIITVLQTHVHNINKPYARIDYSAHDELVRLYQKAENDILNKSIRIN